MGKMKNKKGREKVTRDKDAEPAKSASSVAAPPLSNRSTGRYPMLSDDDDMEMGLVSLEY